MVFHYYEKSVKYIDRTLNPNKSLSLLYVRVKQDCDLLKGKKVKVSYLTWIVYESPHLVWMERLISSRVHGACHYLPDYPV